LGFDSFRTFNSQIRLPRTPAFTAPAVRFFDQSKSSNLDLEDIDMTALADSTHFTPGDVYETTGISVPKQNQLYERGIYKPSPLDKQPTGSGSYRLVVPATVYQIAFAAAASNVGIPTRQGAEAARLYSEDQPGRRANTPFEFGRTLLVIKPTGTQIVNGGYTDTLADILGGQFDTAVVIDIGRIAASVNEKLLKLSEKNK
jgi:hypothetical protein